MITPLSTAFLVIALGSLPSSISMQEKHAPDATVTAEHEGVRIELSGPQQPTNIWAASEWTLRLENGAVDGMPFSEDLFKRGGYSTARIQIEIAKGGTVLRMLSTRSFDYSITCGGGSQGVHILKPGGTAELPTVIHGEMGFDVSAEERAKGVTARFEPAFETTGSYSVTAVLYWDRTTVRSNSVTIEVADAPFGATQAMEELKRLVKAGVCINVQGTFYYPSCALKPRAVVKQIAEFVERQRDTLYGAQLQLGLARALLSVLHRRGGGEPLPSEPEATLERVKSLLPSEPHLDFGLERSLADLRSAVAAYERHVEAERELREFEAQESGRVR